jgi:hypothetical protein
MRVFVVFGAEREPDLRLLTPEQVKLYYDRHMLGIASEKVVAATFGAGYDFAIPAWEKDSLRPIAEGYTGPYELNVRALCAAIWLDMDPDYFLRRGTTPPRLNGSGEDDGYRVPLVPPQPTKPSPSSMFDPITKLPL